MGALILFTYIYIYIVIGANTLKFSFTPILATLKCKVFAQPTCKRHCRPPKMLSLVACHMHFE